MLRVFRLSQVLAVLALFLFVLGLPPRVCWAQAGTLDPSFGTGGKVVTPFGPLDEWAWSMAIQADGKIVVAGRSNAGGTHDFALARYNADGSLDTSFDNDGKVTTDIKVGLNDRALSMAIQADGKIVAAGLSLVDSTNVANVAFALVRYNTNGSLDTSFDPVDADGKVITDFGSLNDTANSVAIQADGKIVAAGLTFLSGTNVAFALVRYNTNGSLDTSFDADGKVITDFGSLNDTAYSVAIQGDGKIVAAGRGRVGGTTDYALARYNADGSLDTSFDGDGKVTIDFAGKLDEALSVAIQADGRIVVAGYAYFEGTGNDIALVRYNADGRLDDTFGTGGVVTTDFYGLEDFAAGMAIQGNGRIVVAGAAKAATVSGDYLDLALARYIGVPPQEEIAFIIDDIQDLVVSGSLNKGQGNGLVVKLQAAIRQLERGNEGAAVNQLGAFANQVNAFMRAGILTPEEGHPLISAALATIDTINAGL